MEFRFTRVEIAYAKVETPFSVKGLVDYIDEQLKNQRIGISHRNYLVAAKNYLLGKEEHNEESILYFIDVGFPGLFKGFIIKQENSKDEIERDSFPEWTYWGVIKEEEQNE